MITLVVILIGYGMDWLMPLPIGDSAVLPTPGVALILIALGIIGVAIISFLKAKTHLEPWKPTSRIISSGIFGLSRNPIYLGFCIATAGIGLILNSWWIVFAVLPLIGLLTCFVIRLEEAYLLRKFGDEYAQYQSRVRRWL